MRMSRSEAWTTRPQSTASSHFQSAGPIMWSDVVFMEHAGARAGSLGKSLSDCLLCIFFTLKMWSPSICIIWVLRNVDSQPLPEFPGDLWACRSLRSDVLVAKVHISWLYLQAFLPSASTSFTTLFFVSLPVYFIFPYFFKFLFIPS